ncbi:MAG: methionyl-tRNA formyltransferase [Nocardioides sp.]
MRVVFAGTPQAAVPSLRAVAARHELLAVVTRPAAPTGRGRKLVPSAVAEAAADYGVPILAPDHPRDPAFGAQLAELAPDCCPVVAYGALIPAPVLAIPRFGWVNLHFSLLPAWRGAAPVQRSIWAGEMVSGATTFRLVPELDAGPVFGVMTETVHPTDTAGDLMARLAEGGATLLADTLDGIEAETLVPVEQPADGVTYAAKIEVADAQVDWTAPAFAVDRQIRACTPDPGAWTTLGGERVRLGPVLLDVPGEGDPATLVPGGVSVSKSEVLVGTGSQPVRLGWVQPPGKRAMPAADWARGLREVPGSFGG